MSSDKVLLIPYLSEELNLIGYKTLPFKVKNKTKSRLGNNINSELNRESIIFNQKEMMCALISACVDLVNQVKTFDIHNYSDEVDKLRFENSKLHKQLSSFNRNIKEMNDKIAKNDLSNNALQEKIQKLERKIRDYELEKKKVVQSNSINENLLKHNLNKQKKELFDLHKVVWKQFNMANSNNFPQNFELLQLNQPNFNKLWSEVKYSSSKSSIVSLKKAVCALQENNQFLLEENFFLKKLLLTTVEEINETTELMLKFMEPHTNNFRSKIFDLLTIKEGLDVSKYQEGVQDQLKKIRKLIELFEESSFHVSDKQFVCWSDIKSKLQGF